LLDRKAWNEAFQIATHQQRVAPREAHSTCFQLHAFDAATPVEEVVATFDDLIRAGEGPRYLGVSNFAGWQPKETIPPRS
jgi:hypothetical protein